MTEPITIGVDHGYAAIKTAHCSFPSGLAEYEHEPYTQKNVLCYDGKYYVVGSGRRRKHSGHICCARANRSLFRMKEFRMKLLCRM